MDDREFKEWVDNVARKKASVLSLLAGLPDYIMSGADERNALEYEAAYTKLLDQVKDKSHDEKVAFLLPHIDELRKIVHELSATDDMRNFMLCCYDKEGDEVLANLLAYRYENHISILDDCEHEITGDYIKDIYYTIDQKYSDERVAEILKYEREHPEEMAKRLENSKELSRLIMTKMKPFIEEHPMEYWLNYGLNSSVNFKKHQ
jgi:hypothetical protein